MFSCFYSWNCSSIHYSDIDCTVWVLDLSFIWERSYCPSSSDYSYKYSLERAEADAREETKAYAEAETRRSAERGGERDAEKAGRERERERDATHEQCGSSSWWATAAVVDVESYQWSWARQWLPCCALDSRARLHKNRRVTIPATHKIRILVRTYSYVHTRTTTFLY